MLEITIDNCQKCDLEGIIDSNSQYFWINRRDLEIESKHNWQEKLGLCLYEIICDEQELISTSEEIFKEEKIITQHDVENKQLRKEENEKLKKEKQLRKKNKQLRKNNVVKDATINKPIEIKSFKEDKNMADDYLNCFDRNKFEKILAVTDSNKFNYKNKIAEFKYINIRDLVNNIRNNTISEISAKKDLNKLNEIKI